MVSRLPCIIIHGGAWRIPEHLWRASKAGVSRAATAGFEAMAKGGSAVDAVEAAVIVMEDDPAFDAGSGSVLTEEGKVELDASIMDGATLNAGAVAAVNGIRNPVTLAR